MLGQLASFSTDFSKALLAAAELFAIADRVPPIDSYSSEGKRLDQFSGHVRLTDVQFKYPARPDVLVLKGLDVEVLPGKTVALVGASGCGKSTVIQLVERFYDPAAGHVLLDGVDLRELNIPWAWSQIGLVGQEPVRGRRAGRGSGRRRGFPPQLTRRRACRRASRRVADRTRAQILFQGTIGENIRYGKPDATQEEVEAAAKEANAHNFITALPDGYSTQVGERGSQLSGGQKQRIAIARALVRNPKVLLLDEATSALDSESEKIVQEALDHARQGRTTIVIAHRLSTIQDADNILVFDGGVVVEHGTHNDLIQLNGRYASLVKNQSMSMI